MRKMVACGIALALCGASAYAAPIDKARLRMLPQLPVHSLNASIKFTEAYGFDLGWMRPDELVEIVTLRKSLRGDATDASIHRHIAKLCQSIQMPDVARVSFAQAARLYFDQIKANPSDGWLRAQYADAWSESADGKRRADAEPVFRQAVQVAPNDWRCWMLMAGYLQRSVKDRFLDEVTQVRYDPKAKQAELDRLLAETRQCLERAAALAPREAQVFADRAYVRSQMGMTLGLLRMRQGERVNFHAEIFAPECVDDLKTAARLKGDARSIGIAALAELSSIRYRDAKLAAAQDPWKSLPEPTRQSLQQSHAALEKLAASPDARQAAEAYEVLGMLDACAWGDDLKASGNYRQAVTKDPSREASWQFLVAAASRSGQPFVEIYSERLKLRDSPVYHLHLARYYDASKKYETLVKAEVEAAVKADPRDFEANLAQAIYLMKYEEETQLPTALAYLTRASEVAREVPTRERRASLGAAMGLYLALVGNLPEARVRFKESLELDDSGEWVRDALDLLGS